MEGVGTLKVAATERTDIYSLTLFYPGNPQGNKKSLLWCHHFPHKFLGKDFDGNPWTTCTILLFHMNTCAGSKALQNLLMLGNFLRGNILALNNAFCSWYGYWHCWSNLYPAILVWKPCNYLYLILPIYPGGNLRCFWDNLWRYMYVNHQKFHRSHLLQQTHNLLQSHDTPHKLI